MNLPDGKQLVRESSGHIKDQHNTRKMGMHAKMAWIALFFCLGLIALVHCVPVEVVNAGEGREECPFKLRYSVNVPNVAGLPKSKKFLNNGNGFRVEVPTARQAKTKITYSLDFTVEEPRPPKSNKPTKLNLYARDDGVATANKDGYEDSYVAASAPSACRCGQRPISNPLYGYVFNNMTPPSPCNCGRSNCQCNRRRATSTQYSPQEIFMRPLFSGMMAKPMVALDSGNDDDGDDRGLNSGGDGAGYGAVNIRHKREVKRSIFQPRDSDRKRSSSLVKLYHKNLYDTPRRLFEEFEGLTNNKQHYQHQPYPRIAKRKSKKPRYTHKRSRLVKRDIKGEYEQLEKELEQMDLTLPEIIQFMPETLQPDFKRGQCYIGCGLQRPTSQPNAAESNSDTPSSSNRKEVKANNSPSFTKHTDTNTDKNKSQMTTMTTGTDNDQFTESEKAINSEKSLINEIADTSTEHDDNGTTLTKRNAAESAYPTYEMPLPALLTKRAYIADFPPTRPISTNPNYESPQPTYPAIAQSAAQPAVEVSPKQPTFSYFNDHMARKYLESHDQLQTLTTALALPDPLDSLAMPLQYVDNLESPIVGQSIYPQHMRPSVATQNYPAQQISYAQIDNIITDIVRRHSEFIDATTHHGGALVDPEPWQKQNTKALIKKLIDRRLNLWIGQADEDQPQRYSPSYSMFDIPALY